MDLNIGGGQVGSFQLISVICTIFIKPGFWINYHTFKFSILCSICSSVVVKFFIPFLEWNSISGSLKAIEDRWKKEAEKGAGLNLSKIQFDFPREIFDTVRNSDNVNQLMRRQQGEKRKKDEN